MGGNAGGAVTRFLIGRLIRLLAILVFASILVFAGLYLAPGSPLSVLSGGRSLTPEQVSQLTAEYHLNDPLWTRYWAWLSGVLHGDLGTSLSGQVPVSHLLASRAGTTFLLVLYATVLIAIFGLALGVLAATRGKAVDNIIVALTGGMAALPSFVAASLLVTLFAVQRTWFPVFGDGTGDGLGSRLWHLTLPALALAIAAMGVTARVTRTALIEERESEHAKVAASRGLPAGRIFRRHILRNSLVPISSAIGLTAATLIAGSVVVEQAFALNGLGSLLVDSVATHDFAVSQAVTLVLVAVFVVVNTVVDLLHPLLDPRLTVEDPA